MKLNTLSYMIKYLQCILATCQTAIYKKPHVVQFEHAESTIINIIKRFHLYYKVLAFIRESS